jgi:hypothetical protein
MSLSHSSVLDGRIVNYESEKMWKMVAVAFMWE